MLTISQRLLAGAMGVPFLTTRSLAGSDMARDLAQCGGYAEIDDPFDARRASGRALVAACVPDLAFVHAWAADPAGNAVCFPPYQENVYGAMAAREGVLLTVQHVVGERLRAAPLAPRAVYRRRGWSRSARLPYGSHPYGNYAVDLAGARALRERLRLHARAPRCPGQRRGLPGLAPRLDPRRRRPRWIPGPKLGADRTRGASSARPTPRAGATSSRPGMPKRSTPRARRPPPPSEEMIVQAARQVATRVGDGRLRLAVLSGRGSGGAGAPGSPSTSDASAECRSPTWPRRGWWVTTRAPPIPSSSTTATWRPPRSSPT